MALPGLTSKPIPTRIAAFTTVSSLFNGGYLLGVEFRKDALQDSGGLILKVLASLVALIIRNDNTCHPINQ